MLNVLQALHAPQIRRRYGLRLLFSADRQVHRVCKRAYRGARLSAFGRRLLDAFRRELEYIISKLREIKHVEIIRLGTRTPVVLPQRITPELCNMLKNIIPYG